MISPPMAELLCGRSARFNLRDPSTGGFQSRNRGEYQTRALESLEIEVPNDQYFVMLIIVGFNLIHKLKFSITIYTKFGDFSIVVN